MGRNLPLLEHWPSAVNPAKRQGYPRVNGFAECSFPGGRRHVQGALAHEASIEEIMDVLKLCGALGVDACELGAPYFTCQVTEAIEHRHAFSRPSRSASLPLGSSSNV